MKKNIAIFEPMVLKRVNWNLQKRRLKKRDLR